MHSKQETQLHFVGIGGIGMSGIAEVFFNQGYRVSGSDLADSDTTRRLRELGVSIAVGHHERNVAGAHVVVVSSAVRPDNPEVVEAKRRRIPVIPRAEMLAELMRGKTAVAIAGTHGKTTTTSLMATVMTHAGLDPTIVNGGKVDNLGGNAKLGQSGLLVAEADESDGSFLQLPATFGVVTNIDNDHLDHYGSISAIEDAFVTFVGKLPFYGLAALCVDDPGVRRCLGRLTKPFVTYGMSEDCDYFAKDVQPHGIGSRFKVFKRVDGKPVELGTIQSNVPGRHNVLNVLAVTAISLRMGIPFEKIAEGIQAFAGVKRRFEVRWRDDSRNCMIVDDYGHHPTEIAATLAAARACWKGKIVTVFQPHRYTRTLHCRDGFLAAFRDCDTLLLTDIYAACEDPIEGVDSKSLAADISLRAVAGQEICYVGDLTSARDAVVQRMKDNTLVLCLGAGSITRLPDQLIAALSPQ